MKSRRRRARRRYSEEYVESASGVAWFDRPQWERLVQVAADPERLENSYEDWLAMANRTIRELEDSGMIIEKVPVDTEELVAWCGEQSRPVDSAARAEFAARQFRKIHLSE